MLKNMRTVYIIGFVVMTLFGIYYYQDILFPSQVSPSKINPSAKQMATSTVTRTFNIDGMYCDSCKKKIEAAVQSLAGVQDASVQLDTKELTVVYDAANENIQGTLKAVNGLGYTAGLKSQSGKLQVLDFNVTFQ